MAAEGLLLNQIDIISMLLIRMGIPDTFGKSGKAEELMKYFKITAEDIVEKMIEI